MNCVEICSVNKAARHFANSIYLAIIGSGYRRELVNFIVNHSL